MWISLRLAGFIARDAGCSNDDVGTGVRAAMVQCRGLTDGGGAFGNIEVEVISLLLWLERVRAARAAAH